MRRIRMIAGASANVLLLAMAILDARRGFITHVSAECFVAAVAAFIYVVHVWTGGDYD